MKISRLNHLFCATAFGSVVFLAVGCSDKKTTADATVAIDQPAQSPSALPTTPNPAPAALAPDASAPAVVAADKPGADADGWAAIKDDTYEQRAHFKAGLQTMASGMDSRITGMNSKSSGMGAGMMGAAMTEVTAARTSLQTASDQLDAATANTWTMDKDAVAQAWTRMQAACTKAQST